VRCLVPSLITWWHFHWYHFQHSQSQKACYLSNFLFSYLFTDLIIFSFLWPSAQWLLQIVSSPTKSLKSTLFHPCIFSQMVWTVFYSLTIVLIISFFKTRRFVVSFYFCLQSDNLWPLIIFSDCMLCIISLLYSHLSFFFGQFVRWVLFNINVHWYRILFRWYGFRPNNPEFAYSMHFFWCY
jgi:hypothetical protein